MSIINTTKLSDKEFEIFSYTHKVIEECLTENFENVPFLFNTVHMEPRNPFVENALDMHGISEETQEDWMEKAQEIEETKDSDFSMIHPNETIDEFREHEDLDD